MSSDRSLRSQIFERTSLVKFDHETSQQPYLTFSLNSGELKHLVLEIWAVYQDPLGVSVSDNSRTAFAFNLVNESDFHGIQTTVLDVEVTPYSVNTWNLGVPHEEVSDADETCAWVESLAQANNLEIGVFPIITTQSQETWVWKMKVLAYFEPDTPLQCSSNTSGSITGDHTQPTPTSPRNSHCSREAGSVNIDADRPLQGAPSHVAHRVTSIVPGNIPQHLSVSHQCPSSSGVEMRFAPDESTGAGEDRGNVPLVVSPEQLKDLCDRNIFLLRQLFFTRTAADLQKALQVAREVVKLTPNDDPDRASHLHHLAVVLALAREFMPSQSDALLDETIAVAQRAVEALPVGHPDLSEYLSQLGHYFEARYEQQNHRPDLEDAIASATEAARISQSSDDDDRQIQYHSHLATLLYTRFELDRNLADIELAIGIGREHARFLPENHPERARTLHNLAVHIHARFERFGDSADLEESTKFAREAAKASRDSQPDRPSILCGLGARLGNCYAQTGKIEYLEEAISTTRSGISIMPEDDQSMAGSANTLALLLWDRYGHVGAVSDLEEAIRWMRQVISIEHGRNVTGATRARHLSNLTVQLLDRYLRLEQLGDINEAIDLGYESLTLVSANHPDRGGILHNLGRLLSARGHGLKSSSDLDAAIDVIREAVEATIDSDPSLADYLDNLSLRLGDRYCRNETFEDLEEAIEVARRCVRATPQHHPHRASHLGTLGMQIALRYNRTQNMADLDEAQHHFKEALFSSASQTRSRIQAGRMFLNSPQILKDPEDAISVIDTVADLIPLLTSHSLQAVDKQRRLIHAVGLAADATAIALALGRNPFDALQALEKGRGLLAGSLQNLRTDVTELEQQDPENARTFRNLSRQLDQPLPTSDRDLSLDSRSESAARAVDQRHKASIAMETLLGAIRRRPGFERFLLSATEAEVCSLAHRGPIIVINASRHRCDAFIVEAAGVRCLNLPRLSLLDISEHAAHLRHPRTLSWLWDVVVRPVLDSLGFIQDELQNGALPHVWWVPTGPLVRFPLHAAGQHLDPEQENMTALDRVISSYGISIKALLHTRRSIHGHLASESLSNVVLVSMPETPLQDYLQYATEETCTVQAISESIGFSCVAPRCVKRDVLASLDRCHILHFAGHGGTRKEALQSLLLLNDWETDPLTVESLLTVNLSSNTPFLAYLSACGTGHVETSYYLDEGVHLTSSFQLAGFRHVVGTLWEVDDKLCVDMASLFFEFLVDKKHEIGDEVVGRALHHAQVILRDAWVCEATKSTRSERDARIVKVDESQAVQALWVPYVHYGV